MSGNQLAKFFATVGFKTDLSEWDSAIAKIKKDVAGIATAIKVPKDVRTKTTQIVETINKVSGKKLTPVQRANQAIKAEAGFLEAAKIKSLKLITESNARSLVADARLRAERRATVLAEKKSSARTEEVKARTAYAQSRQAIVDRQISLQRLRNESKAIGTRVRESVGGGGNFSGGFMGNLDWKSVVAGGTLAGIAKQMYTVANFQAGQEPQYEFITGSKEKAGEQIKFINGLVDKLKLNLVDADASYKQFLGAVNSTIGAEKAQKTFESLTKFSVMMGTTEEQYKRGLKAVTQMLSKQKLSAEELTGTNVPDYPRNRVMRTYLMREALRA